MPGAAAVSTELMRPIRGYGNIDQQWQAFERTYHSVQTSFTRRFRNGFSGGLNYTLSLSDNGTTGVPLRLQHSADGSFSIRDDQGQFNELMKNQGLQRHFVKGNFVWDLPDVTGDGARAQRRRRGGQRLAVVGHLHGRFRRALRHLVQLPEQRREREPHGFA